MAHRIQIRFEDELYAQIKAVTDEQGISINKWIARIVEAHLTGNPATIQTTQSLAVIPEEPMQTTAELVTAENKQIIELTAKVEKLEQTVVELKADQQNTNEAVGEYVAQVNIDVQALVVQMEDIQKKLQTASHINSNGHKPQTKTDDDFSAATNHVSDRKTKEQTLDNNYGNSNNGHKSVAAHTLPVVEKQKEEKKKARPQDNISLTDDLPDFDENEVRIQPKEAFELPPLPKPVPSEQSLETIHLRLTHTSEVDIPEIAPEDLLAICEDTHISDGRLQGVWYWHKDIYDQEQLKLEGKFAPEVDDLIRYWTKNKYGRKEFNLHLSRKMTEMYKKQEEAEKEYQERTAKLEAEKALESPEEQHKELKAEFDENDYMPQDMIKVILSGKVTNDVVLPKDWLDKTQKKYSPDGLKGLITAMLPFDCGVTADEFIDRINKNFDSYLAETLEMHKNGELDKYDVPEEEEEEITEDLPDEDEDEDDEDEESIQANLDAFDFYMDGMLPTW